jgi:hypothetical protein
MPINAPKRSAAMLPPLSRGGLGRGLRQWRGHQGSMQTNPPQPPSIPPSQGGGKPRGGSVIPQGRQPAAPATAAADARRPEGRDFNPKLVLRWKKQ